MTAGIVLSEEKHKYEDLLVKFTPNDPTLSVKAFDIRNGENTEFQYPLINWM